MRKLQGNRKKPFQAITSKYNKDLHKQIYKSLGTYETREQAEFELYKYLSGDTQSIITISDLYSEWSKSKFKTLSDATIKYYKVSYNSLHEIYNQDIASLNLRIIQDACSKNKPVQQKQFKLLLNILYEYAIANDYVTKNYAKYIVTEHYNIKEKCVFTEDEIRKIENNLKSHEIYTIIKILLYTGLRINELLNIKKSDVNISKRYILISKSKTAAGHRKIPIHKEILDILDNKLNNSQTYLFPDKKNKMLDYNRVRKYFINVFPEHTLHETRHTFITQAKKCNIDMYALKKIVGHAISDITLDVYTHENFDFLLHEIDKIIY